MLALGLVFSDIHEWNMGELTSNRTVAAIPFAGRYWLIDFALSNMINSGIHKVGIITKSNYQSLMGYIGSGKDWDLSRKNGGITILPPYGEGSATGLYRGRLDAMMRIMNYISSGEHDIVVLTDCDVICNVNFKKVIDQHIKTNADITAVYHEHYIDSEVAQHSMIYRISKLHNRVEEVTLYPQQLEGNYKISMNAWVMKKDYLLNLITTAIANGKTKFSRDILLADVETRNIIGYEYKGYCAHIDSVKSYFKHNMDILNFEKRNELFYPGRQFYTKVRDSQPTRYGMTAKVRNSIIADGCHIEGEISNCVIFRGVKIGKNSKIKNCIVMQDAVIGENTELEWIILDKNTLIRDNKKLIADKEYFTYVIKNTHI